MSIVVVTGSSSGIGLSTALAFARRGDRVHASMRHPAKGRALVDAARDEGLDITIGELDVTDDESVERAVCALLRREGRIDVLVNNAGIVRPGAVEQLPEAEVRALFETNFFGPVRMIRAVLPAMRARGSGAIVNVSSLAGRVPTLPANAFYAATKHALSVLSGGLAIEVESFGIRVACVEPGFARSSIVTNAAYARGPESPYRALEDAAFGVLDEGVAGGIDPAIVADAVVDAAEAPVGSPVHVLVGEDARQYVDAYRSIDELEYTRLVREYVGLAPSPNGGPS